MKFTNARGLPGPLHSMLTYNDYNSSGMRFDTSATRVIDSPQIAAFRKSHGKEVVEDSAQRLWSSAGSGIHSRLEAANASNPDTLSEKRFIEEFPHPSGEGTLKLSAQIDTYEMSRKCLSDLKSCSVWKVVNGDYTQWEQQLNIGACLMRMAGHEVESLEIWAILRDWSKARINDKDYPNNALSVVSIPLWTLAEQQAFIAERLELHFGEGEKTCSDKERWARPAQFAVKEKGKKRALRVLLSREKAESWMTSQGRGDRIEERPATYTRCESYCSFKQWCPQYNNATEVAQQPQEG